MAQGYLTCTKCREIKPDDSFGLRKERSSGGKRRGRQSSCRDCQSTALRAWWAANRYTERHSREQYSALLAALKAAPCTDCGGRFHPGVMDFDHVRGEKLYAISRETLRRDDILFELAKCELRCSNCHRLRHALEREAQHA